MAFAFGLLSCSHRCLRAPCTDFVPPTFHHAGRPGFGPALGRRGVKKFDQGAVLLSIGLALSGALKTYLHHASVWRAGPVDYLLALAGILAGGLLARLVRTRTVPGVGPAAAFVGLMAMPILNLRRLQGPGRRRLLALHNRGRGIGPRNGVPPHRLWRTSPGEDLGHTPGLRVAAGHPG